MIKKTAILILSIFILLTNLSVYASPAKAVIYPPSVSQYELTFNPSGPELSNGKLNPFAVPKIREAMNVLIDRNHIVDQIESAYVRKSWFPISTFGDDYAKLSSICQALEEQYAHDFSEAEAIIAQEMLDLGAEKQEESWIYNDKVVEIIFVIRTEDCRKEIGDYVADLLEQLGFSVVRLYKNASEAAQIWMFSPPAEGLWHIYTGSWAVLNLADESDVFQEFYTPDSQHNGHRLLWQAYHPTTSFNALANKLADQSYDTEQERLDDMALALTMAMEDSVRIWLAESVYEIFWDVPAFADYWAYDWIQRLYDAGITSGCSQVPPLYCPDQSVTRAEMAKFLLKGVHGGEYEAPPISTSTGFDDVPTDYWAADWITQLALEGITSGCGGGNYCPNNQVTRAEMAKFLLTAKHGAGYTPPAVDEGTGFDDVPDTYWAAAWIKELAAEGITSGCGEGNYCPNDDVTRAEMAKFLVLAFNLP